MIDWPASSPDAATIKNLCGLMAKCIYKSRKKQYDSRDELELAICQCWVSIEVGVLERLSNLMTKRCMDLIANLGGKISY